jgi:hypothetical protein
MILQISLRWARCWTLWRVHTLLIVLTIVHEGLAAATLAKPIVAQEQHSSLGKGPLEVGGADFFA